MTSNNLTLELPNFEGPLDLLLHLIRSQKIDIYDIPISQITSQYLDYLTKMQKLNLQIAGEYFVMSSTLLRIKSQYLLPKNDFVEDSVQEDPREELVEQLVQYSVFKRVSSYFKERNEEVPITIAKEPSASTKKVHPLPMGKISAEELADTFSLILKKLKLKHPEAMAIKAKERPLSEMSSFLRTEIKKQKKISFFACATKLNNLSDVIGLFLAMLELCKKHEISIKQKRSFGDLELEGVVAHGK
ncbi:MULTISPECIES: ScpA family protein [Lactobacillus]|uniref:Segregation and condensation protein A n=1 Tax=Lactobacillus xujianguonis TaxID=2495899 RepID=A0A437SY44_9LACO|nr:MULTISPECIES: segregation/condensation protein A [Lactobacillus]RVU71836.1 segregation and condensation protein A [Lactobacillus xujianguonis]RVU77612.1 segregation and condensation protein A [Lactobacillus xujianguonis]